MRAKGSIGPDRLHGQELPFHRNTRTGRVRRLLTVVLIVMAAVCGSLLGVYLALPDAREPVKGMAVLDRITHAILPRGERGSGAGAGGIFRPSGTDRGAAPSVARFSGERLRGRPRVVDADTLDVAGERVRLQGIDAPEGKQLCRRSNGRRYRCGRAAAQALRARIAGNSVTCEVDGRDSGGRALGTCHVSGVNLNRWLVEKGHALAFRRYSVRYVAEEKAARAARAGIHGSDYVPPWRWRRGERLP